MDMRTRKDRFRIGVVTVGLVALIVGGVAIWKQGENDTFEETSGKAKSYVEASDQSDTKDENTASRSNKNGSDQKNKMDTASEITEETSGNAEGKKEITEDNSAISTEKQEKEEESAEETSGQAALDSLNFGEETILASPVSGTVLIPYSMENTVYFSTLDLYQCNPGMVISADVGTPVAAVADSEVVKVENHPRTGITVTLNMGNGYEALYGQLSDVSLEAGQKIKAGEQIGTVAEPTKYFVKEGSNLFFEMKKDGKTLDPSMYLPPEAE